ncbi:MAG TPA: hypothetical protein VET69_00890 [Terriglobales bacterium]|nr:hypothetical protein [Terriglobales bacterium]
MANNELFSLAQLQQDTAEALAALSQPLSGASALSAATQQVAQSASSTQGTHASQTASAAAPSAPSSGSTALASALNDATTAVNQLAQNTLTQIEQLQNLNQSMGSLPSLLGELAGGTGGSGGGLLGGILGGGLVSLGTAIAHLFTGGPSTPAPLPVYKPPPSLSVDVANSPGLPPVAQDQNGGVNAAPAQGQGTQVTVNISAMDSQSFLDRSSDIARAVREAMLHMDPVNDLINEL